MIALARERLPDVPLHVARMRLSNVDAESTLRIVQEIETESQKLADVDVDVIIFPATAPSSRNGIARISNRTSSPPRISCRRRRRVIAQAPSRRLMW